MTLLARIGRRRSFGVGHTPKVLAVLILTAFLLGTWVMASEPWGRWTDVVLAGVLWAGLFAYGSAPWHRVPLWRRWSTANALWRERPAVVLIQDAILIGAVVSSFVPLWPTDLGLLHTVPGELIVPVAFWIARLLQKAVEARYDRRSWQVERSSDTHHPTL